jgi:hypothetical protein
MRHIVLNLVAAAALLASVGAAAAKDPLTLTDVQLDKATAGDTTNEVVFLVGISETDLSRLQAISDFAHGWLNSFPQPLPGLSATGLTAAP